MNYMIKEKATNNLTIFWTDADTEMASYLVKLYKNKLSELPRMFPRHGYQLTPMKGRKIFKRIIV